MSSSILSQTTKESVVRKKRRKLEFQQPLPSSETGKSPLPLNPTDVPTNPTPVLQQQLKKERKKARLHQAESGYVTVGDDSPKGRLIAAQLAAEVAQSTTTAGATPNGSPGLDELHPFSNPDHALRDALKAVDSDDWSCKCEGLLAVRRVAMFHPEVLGPQLHTAILAVQKEVKNLRSQVSRSAIACLGDLFALMGKAMEPDLDGMVRILLHKGGESNTFIREDVEKALMEMINNLSHSRSLQAIIGSGIGHRNVQVRKMTAQLICTSVEVCGPQKLLHSTKDLEKALPAIVKLVGDNSPETRYYARKALDSLWTQPEFDRASSRVLSAPLLSKLKDAVEFLRTKGIGDSPTELHSARHHQAGSNSRHSTGGPVRVSTHSTPGRKGSIDKGCGLRQDPGPGPAPAAAPPAVKEGMTKRSAKKHASSAQVSVPQHGPSDSRIPDGLLEHLRGTDWSERYDAISALESFTDSHPTALEGHLHKVFDVFSPRLTDRNSKVNLHALQVFSNMVPLLGNALIPVLSGVMTALVPNLASKNATINATALDVMDLLTQCVDPIYLVQPFVANGLYGNAKVQPVLFKKLAEVTTMVYPLKPQAVTRQVLPVMWHILSARTPPTGDVKAAVAILFEALYDCLGQSFLDGACHLSPAAQSRLREFASDLSR